MSSELVVIGCPVLNSSWCLDDWWRNATMQTDNWKAAFAYSPSEDDTLAKLQQHDVEIIDVGPSPRSSEQQRNHWWSEAEAHFEHMAAARNALLDYATNVGAQWFFSVDSDIMLPPTAYTMLHDTLVDRLTYGCGAIAPVVNMAVHVDAIAYNYMYWNDADGASAMRPDRIMPVGWFIADVIMGAMLIHRSAFHVRWHSHPQGEDLGWSYDAKTKGVRLIVDPRIVCNHRMKRLPA